MTYRTGRRSAGRWLAASAAFITLAACSAANATTPPGATTAQAAVPDQSSGPSQSLTGTASASASASRSATPAAKATPSRPSSRPSTAPRATTVAPSSAAARAVTGVSWNTHVSCKPVLTTLAKVLGTQRSALGGATLAGGGFKPGIPDRRSTNPPCSVSGVPTLVELHRVTVGSCAKINADGDWTCELTDPALPASVTADFRAIHIEIDGNFRAKGWAPAIPPGGRLIDVQGFVFWDPDHTTAAFHHHSGWELHSFTAWRLAV